MCGRYYIDKSMMPALGKLFPSEKRMLRYDYTGDVYPSAKAPVIMKQGLRTIPALMKWGYGFEGGSRPLINARSETLMEKSMFKTAAASQRIAVPASGFYEWNKDKEKSRFRRNDSPLMFMAGIYLYGVSGPGFVIITASANASMAMVHDRMPLVLENDQINDWLEDTKAAGDILRQVPCMLNRECEYEQMRLF